MNYFKKKMNEINFASLQKKVKSFLAFNNYNDKKTGQFSRFSVKFFSI